jgi:hypothetical protein
MWVREALAIEFSDEPWLYEPTAADAAGICFSLDQVTASVLPQFRQRLARGYDLKRWDRHLSVGVFLDETNPRPAELFDPDQLRQCQEEAYRYAAEFTTSHSG